MQLRTRLMSAGLAAGLIATVGLPSLAEDVPHVLVYSGTFNFRHGSVDYGNAVLEQLSTDTGRFAIEVTEDPRVAFSLDALSGTDLVLFNSPSGISPTGDGSGVDDESPFTDEEEELFLDWVGCGGGVFGVHQAADAWHDWPEWDELIGVTFNSHPHTGYEEASGQATVQVEAPDHPTMEPWSDQATFSNADEYYKWNVNPRGTQDVEVLLSIDETSVYPHLLVTNPYEDDQPLSWTKSFRGLNRVLYQNLGHNNFVWDRPDYQEHLVLGIEWVAGQRPDADCVVSLGSAGGTATDEAAPEADGADAANGGTPTDTPSTGGGLAAASLLSLGALVTMRRRRPGSHAAGRAH